MTKQVFIVFGETGEYSDRKDWIVAAYTDEKLAEKHVELAECRLRELGLSEDLIPRNTKPRNADFGPLDPSFMCDYTGTRYYLVGTEVSDSVPGIANDA